MKFSKGLIQNKLTLQFGGFSFNNLGHGTIESIHDLKNKEEELA